MNNCYSDLDDNNLYSDLNGNKLFDSNDLYSFDSSNQKDISNKEKQSNDNSFEHIQNLIDSNEEYSTITLSGTYKGNGEPIHVNKSVILKGNPSASLNANQLSQILVITANNVRIENINFLNGDANKPFSADTGGAIYAEGENLEISQCNFTSNSAQYGGAIASLGNGFSLYNSNFARNTAFYSGGAIHLVSNSSNVFGCDFKNNCGYHAGGSIAWVGDDGSLTNCLFYNSIKDINDASQFGGAVVWIGNNGKIKQTKFLNNTAKNSGAAVYWRGLNGELSHSIFENNTSKNDLAYWGNPDYLKNDFFGFNINSKEDFIDSRLAYYNDSFKAPENWVNIILVRDYLEWEDVANLYLYFASSNDEYLEDLPSYEINVSSILNDLDTEANAISSNRLPCYYHGENIGHDRICISNKYNLNESFDLYFKSVPLIRTGNDTKDILDAVEKAKEGDKILLNENDFDETFIIDTINLLDKSLDFDGYGKTILQLSNSSNVFFNTSSSGYDITDDSGKISKVPYNLSIEGITFIVKNTDTIVLANAKNSSNPLAIDVESIGIENNKILKRDDDTVGESIYILKLKSERPILSPIGEIKISNNDIDLGINPFKFEITSIQNGNDVEINNRTDFSRKVSFIKYSNMTTESVVASVQGRTGKYFTVRLTDSNDNPLSHRNIQIGFNGKIYNRTTEYDGRASLQINLQYTGTYTFAISFLGDEEYNGSFEVAKIVVKKQNPSLSLDKVYCKASDKTKKISAELYDNYLNPLANKILKFTIDGKTYSAKTNSKGQASVKLSLSSKKFYKFTVKFAGDSFYNSASGSNTLYLLSDEAWKVQNEKVNGANSNPSSNGAYAKRSMNNIKKIAESAIKEDGYYISSIVDVGDCFSCLIADSNGKQVGAILVSYDGRIVGGMGS